MPIPQATARLQRKITELGTMQRVSHTIASTLDLDDVLRLIAEQAVALFNVEAAAIIRFSGRSGDPPEPPTVGYRAGRAGTRLTLQVGFSHPVEIAPPPGIAFEVETPTRVHVVGIDKALVGEIAAQVRRVRPPEPYLGKGIRYSDEIIRRKAGKTGK